MDREPDRLIIVARGSWKHIPLVRVYHRHYPELRGEARSLGAAIRQLAGRMICCLEVARGPEVRAAMSQALEDLQEFRASAHHQMKESRKESQLAGSRS